MRRFCSFVVVGGFLFFAGAAAAQNVELGPRDLPAAGVENPGGTLSDDGLGDLGSFNDGPVPDPGLVPGPGPAYNILLSLSPDRSSAVPLQGASISGNVFIFTGPDDNIDRVRFWVDNQAMSGPPTKLENSEPYDFAGTDANGQALPFNSAGLSDGAHTLTARLDTFTGSFVVVHAQFIVANNQPSLVVDMAALTFNLQQGEFDEAVVQLSASDGSAVDFNLSENSAWLTVTADASQTPAALTFEVDAAGLNPGGYAAAVQITSPGLLPAVVNVSLNIGSTETALYVSTMPNRSSPVLLDGHTVSGVIYVFTAPDTDVNRVRFWLDNPAMTGNPIKTENSGPFDLAGTTANGLAMPFNSFALFDGAHVISAEVRNSAGQLTAIHAGFTVINNADGALVATPSTLQFDLEQGQSDSAVVDLTTSNGSSTSFTVVENTPWLVVSANSASTPAELTVTADAAGLSSGTHAAAVQIQAGGLASAVVHVTLSVAGGELDVFVSTSPDRSAPVALDGQVVAGDVFVFTAPDNGVDRVRFWLDNPAMSGPPLRTENSAPFDLAGSAANGSALPYHTANLADGPHTLTTEILLDGGELFPIHAAFTVNNNAPSLVVNPGSMVFDLEEGESDSQVAALSASNGAAVGFTIIESAPWLTVQPSASTTPANLTFNVNGAGLAPGSHGAVVQITASGYASASVAVTVNVGATGAVDLFVSFAPDRSSPQPLDQAVVGGNIYVFTAPDDGVDRVRFWLDNPAMTGSPFKTENNAPYDFAGSAMDLTALPYDSSQLADGPHTISAEVTLQSGTLTVHAQFTVDNNIPRLVFVPAETGASVNLDETFVSTVDLEASDDAALSFTISGAPAWLQVAPLSGTTPMELTLTADAEGLSPGAYEATVTASAPGYLPGTLTYTFIVGSTGGCFPLACSEILVDLPHRLDFSQDHGFILDGSGAGTGFTYIDLPSNGTGYIPENITLNTTEGVLELFTTSGLASNAANSQDNTLLVGVDAPSQVTVVRTTIINPPAGTGNFEQGGLWFGNDEDHYVKLHVQSKNTGMSIEMALEENGTRTALRKVEMLNLSNTTVTLTLVADPTDLSLRGSYQLNGGAPQDFQVVIGYPELFSFDAAGINPEIGTRTFAGIYASHRNGPAPVVYEFDQFEVLGVPIAGPGSEYAFERVSHGVNKPTSMAWGPDDRLYVLELFGTIHALTYDADKSVIDDEVITALVDDLGPRLSLGLTIDPASTAEEVILWVSSSSPSIENGMPNSGMISTLSSSGSGWATVEHPITGLPRAIANHATNSIHFGPDGRLYIAQGGNTGAGAPNTANTEFGPMAEQPLSAALLVADVFAPGFDGSCHNASDIFGTPPCDVEVYSSGLRNMYDFVFHSNGHLYGPENGLGVTGTYPPTPVAPCLGFGDPSQHFPGEQPDTLLRLEPGKYYGHPNPYRGECVFGDGAEQGVAPLPNYKAPIFVLGDHKSANGMIEYHGTAFCGQIQGDLLVANYSVGDNITRITLSPDGLSVLNTSNLVGGFNDPLPVAQSPDGTLYVGEFGGNLVTALVPLDPGCWSTAAAMPVQILDAGGTAVGDKLYVVGGETNPGGASSALYIYDAVANTWSVGPDLPGVAVEDPAAVELDGKLYVMGGATESFSGAVANVAVYDPQNPGWTSLAPMPTPRQGAAAGVIDGLIYVAGGLGGNGASLNVVEVYDPVANDWTTVAPMIQRRDHCMGGVIDGMLYVFGGRIREANGSTVDPTLDTVEVYDPLSDTWEFRASMPTGRRTGVVGTLNGRFQVIGGEVTPEGATFEANEEYDPVTDTWRFLAPMPTPRHGAVGGVINGVLYTAGGGPQGGTSFSNVNETFRYSD